MNFNSLNSLLNKYWTDNKKGNYSDIVNQHGMILLKNLKTEPTEFFDFLNNNKFNFKEFDIISWSEFMKRSGLSDYLKDNYLHDALCVTTTRPAIGKGEFLFVASFSNIGFSSGKGDLIDLNTKEKIEVKGIRATISGDGIKYKQMNRSIMTSVFSVYDSGNNIGFFNRTAAEELDKLIVSNHDKYKLTNILTRLQNISNESQAIAMKFANLYDYNKPNIFELVGAMQLYIYLADISYLMLTNTSGFKCFKLIHTPDYMLDIVKHKKIKLSSWNTGTNGMEIGL